MMVMQNLKVIYLSLDFDLTKGFCFLKLNLMDSDLMKGLSLTKGFCLRKDSDLNLGLNWNLN
jgi:hypothetical protein